MILILLCVGFFTSCLGFQDDEIKELPGLQSPIKFKQYSGYLDAGEGRNLHYWFVESEQNPSQDPVFLWLNGGPGCSSLGGLLTELGPFRVNKTNPSQLYMNDHRWNLRGNFLFLESPAGVGFSYKEDDDLQTDDAMTAEGNLLALQSFFKKFPQFKKNAFFVSGESYGGIYVPTLVQSILKSNQDSQEQINLQGYAIGNGYLDKHLLDDSMPVFGYTHGLLSHKGFDKLVKTCCRGKEGNSSSSLGCRFSQNKSTACQIAVRQVTGEIFNPVINPYNVYKKCQGLDDSISNQAGVLQRSSSRSSRSSRSSQSSRLSYDLRLINEDIEEIQTRSLIKNSQPEEMATKSESGPPCVDDSHVEKYLSNPEVRKALHIPDEVNDWTLCSLPHELYHRATPSVKTIIQDLAHEGVKGMIFNGDVDMICNFLADQWFVESLGLKVIKPFDWWKNGNQVAGKIKYFDNLIFTTVRGAGHMVPEDKPEESLVMLDMFLKWALSK